ncbi:uncharacterized protein LOC122850876 [Aphidius gifuensis]|uniref:uncharacterized protein LOC122850876 n=1 Tax=Aphidius gifuensis TaxID=684658 RepID=UPI001CDCBF16|nr:uncharacterized protein LOC122850876 [Aphidius gifuensis]
MGNLPKARVNEAIPFTIVGVDFCGPFLVKEKKRNRIKVKIYVAVFVCLVIKAVHLEMVSDLTTDCFIAALKRFVARRGYPTDIYSDNGLNFQGANNELIKLLNQKKIRADSYQGLIDHLKTAANESKADLFITMTCNPNWREIKENLLMGQTASDRPGIVSRVFGIKKNELINKIVKEKLFWEIQAYVYVVEYQKRGLPHVHALFTLEQNLDEIMDKALLCRKDDLNSCFYIDGPGGSGKTYVYSTIYHLLRSDGKKVATMAFTGIAAILLPEGRTMHNLFAMPVAMYADSTSNIKQQSKAAELRNIDVIICDEAPMAPRYCLELADRTCRDIMNNKLPFENMRTLPEKSEFAKYILDVGNGTINDNNDNLMNASMKVYRKLLYYHVDNINDKVVQFLDKDTEKIFTGIDSTENCDNGELNNSILPEYLNTLNPPNFPPYELKLRLYCIVMLLRNISQSEGLCNGTRLQILSMSNNLLKCKILTGDKANDIVFIHRITLYCEDVYPFTFKRRQFPIKIAFGMTINKCQGQTFEMVGVDLRKDVFNHGQLYVAFSRIN